MTAAVDSHSLIFNVDVNQPNLTITPNVSFAYPQVGIKITTPGFELDNQGQDCTPASNGFCLFATSPQNPKTLSVTGQGTFDFQICANGTAPLNCQNYSANFPLPPVPPVIFPSKAYISGNDSENLFICDLMTSGVLSNCNESTAVTGLDDPIGVAIFNTASKLYIANNQAGDIQGCDVLESGNLDNCSQAADFTSLGQPVGLAMNAQASKLYATTSAGQPLVTCDLSMTGDISNCTAQVIGIDDPLLLVLNADATRLYTIDSNTGEIVKCDVAQSGTVSNCGIQDMAPGAVPFIGVALNPTASKLYGTSAPDVIYACDVAGDGTISGCMIAAQPAGLMTPAGISFNAPASKLYVNGLVSNDIFSCDVAEDGSLNNCAQTAQPAGLLGPADITIN